MSGLASVAVRLAGGLVVSDVVLTTPPAWQWGAVLVGLISLALLLVILCRWREGHRHEQDRPAASVV